MRIYCLYCLETLPAADARCDACGRISLAADRQRYWNLHPTLRRIEAWIKAVSLLVLVAATVAALAYMRPGFGASYGFVFALPFAAQAAIALTANKLTRHGSFRPSIFWPIALVGAGIALAPLWPGSLALVPVGLIAVPYACRHLRLWKEHVQDRGDRQSIALRLRLQKAARVAATRPTFRHERKPRRTW